MPDPECRVATGDCPGATGTQYSSPPSAPRHPGFARASPLVRPFSRKRYGTTTTPTLPPNSSGAWPAPSGTPHGPPSTLRLKRWTPAGSPSANR